MSVHSFFDDTVAAGWQPVDPCTDPAELATLESSLARGDCISPLIQNGDTVYVDRAMKPEPGDVVSFALSQRGADAQNMPPMPPGQTAGQWKRGDKWCKLYGIEHGFGMLYDRHGSAATATLMACESPDDVPVLHVVRNILRGGRLLFGPSAPTAPMIPRRGVLLGALGGLALAGCDFAGGNVPELPAVDETSCGQIGANAATGTGSLAVAGPNTYNAGTLPGSPNYYGSYTGAAIDAASVVGATLTFDCVQTVSGSYAQVYMEANWGAGTQDSDIVQINPIGVGQRYVIQKFFTALPAATAWSIKIRLNCSSSASFTMSNTLLQVETVKR